MSLAPSSMLSTPTAPGVRLVACGVVMCQPRRDGYTHVPVFMVEPDGACVVCFDRRGTWAENTKVWTPCWNCA